MAMKIIQEEIWDDGAKYYSNENEQCDQEENSQE